MNYSWIWLNNNNFNYFWYYHSPPKWKCPLFYDLLMITIQGQNLAFLMQLSAGLPKKKKKNFSSPEKKLLDPGNRPFPWNIKNFKSLLGYCLKFTWSNLQDKFTCSWVTGSILFFLPFSYAPYHKVNYKFNMSYLEKNP